MDRHPLRRIIKACDQAISERNFDVLMNYYADDATLVIKPGMVVQGKEKIKQAFIAIAEHFHHQLTVEQGNMQVIEGGGDALVIMETVLHYPDSAGNTVTESRRATYVFRQYGAENWLCTIDNSYGTALLG
ncbi:YybH family protein [Mangrovibacter plantisponsor]|uniref:Uncharacterized protein (TIGR02246 family) n=1 Tax=Mangrovibacter plantisponsor TaxID=451513 RepID=A0A317PU84_9ENTR|nr:DUF4440 domain-containing protein [Mangrovibacter plantisponsor]PWW04659.1 uncharacterized protein (TIGR02246 family) [Mangrovibacter plantisponsor]